MRSRRGPATVTGRCCRTRPLGSPRLPGKARQSSPEARRPVPGQPTRPSRKGWLTDENHCLDCGAGVADRACRAAGRRGCERRRGSPRRQPERPARRPHASTATRPPCRPTRRPTASAPAAAAPGRASPVHGATALGIVVEAAKSQSAAQSAAADRHVRLAGLRPGRLRHRRTGGLRFGLLVHEGRSRGASRWAARSSPIHGGQQVLWYLAAELPAARGARAERDPVREPVGAPFPVQVLAYARRRDGDAGGRSGHLRQRRAGRRRTLRATRWSASAGPVRARSRPRSATTSRARSTSICSFDAVTDAPSAGRLIVGSDDVDDISGTVGDDQIRATGRTTTGFARWRATTGSTSAAGARTASTAVAAPTRSRPTSATSSPRTASSAAAAARSTSATSTRGRARSDLRPHPGDRPGALSPRRSPVAGSAPARTRATSRSPSPGTTAAGSSSRRPIRSTSPTPFSASSTATRTSRRATAAASSSRSTGSPERRAAGAPATGSST